MDICEVATTRPFDLLSVVGTRPEAIKIAPIAIAAHRRPGLRHRILATGQHDMPFDDALDGFGLSPDLRLPPVLRDPCPDAMTERLATAIRPILAAERPDMVLVQGDTTSAYADARAADALGIPVGHVEAGLRSHDWTQPWPEERNRVMIDRIAALLFAPTDDAATNLLAEGDAVRGHIAITGNTGIDALLAMRASLPLTVPSDADARRLVLLTCHRRENFGAGVAAICDAVLRLVARGDVTVLCPVHPNPQVADTIRRRLGDHPAIVLTGALPYRETVAAMATAQLILTDSGGIQEEAPALGTPTLVLRDVTERPEGLAAGNLALVGTDPDRIVATASRLLDDPAAHAAMARPAFPFGRGDAAIRILDIIEHYVSGGLRDVRPLRSQPLWIKDSAR